MTLPSQNIGLERSCNCCKGKLKRKSETFTQSIMTNNKVYYSKALKFCRKCVKKETIVRDFFKS